MAIKNPNDFPITTSREHPLILQAQKGPAPRFHDASQAEGLCGAKAHQVEIWRSWGSLGREILLDMIIWYNMTCWVYSIFKLHQSTSIYINLHQSTSIYYVAWLNMIKLLKLIWFEESNSWRSWSLATGWMFALSRQTSSAPPSRAGSVRSARSATRTFFRTWETNNPNSLH